MIEFWHVLMMSAFKRMSILSDYSIRKASTDLYQICTFKNRPCFPSRVALHRVTSFPWTFLTTLRTSKQLILTTLTCPSKQILSAMSVPPSTVSRFVKKNHVPKKDLQTTLVTSQLMVWHTWLHSLFDLPNWLLMQRCFIQQNSAVILQNILGVQCLTYRTLYLVLYS